MNKTILYALFILFSTLLLVSCGNRRSPTGGPVDNVSPEIVYTIPMEFEQIENNEIIIAFSKPMDRTSVMSGLLISPPQVNLRTNWRRNNLHIGLEDNLRENSNVLVFLRRTIKCERNNQFENNQLLVFRNGELQRNSVSGYITHDFPDLTDREIHFSLLDSDSLLVFNKTIPGNNYSLNYLNPGKYTLTAFLDVNNNNRFDFTIDASYSTIFELPISHRIDLHLAVADTLTPNFMSIVSQVNNQVNITYNKELLRAPHIVIINDSTNTVIDILHHDFIENMSFLLTAPMDTLTHRIQFVNLIDLNERASNRTGSFFSNGRPDTSPPEIIETHPRDGTVVNSISPEITIRFNKIMRSNDVTLSLIETETDSVIPLRPLTRAGFTVIFQVLQNLRVFNSYQLIITTETQDVLGNHLQEERFIQFIVVP